MTLCGAWRRRRYGLWGGSAFLLPSSTPPDAAPGNLAETTPLPPGAVSTLPCSTACPTLAWRGTALPTVAGTSSFSSVGTRPRPGVLLALVCVPPWDSMRPRLGPLLWKSWGVLDHGRWGGRVPGGSLSCSSRFLVDSPSGLPAASSLQACSPSGLHCCITPAALPCPAPTHSAGPQEQAQVGERGPVARARPTGVQRGSGRAVWWARLARPANFLLCSLSLSLSICLHRLSAGRGEDAWASFPRLVSTVGPGCARCPECPGRVHAVSFGRAVTSVLPRPPTPNPPTALSE